jgi:hypothetical protein
MDLVGFAYKEKEVVMSKLLDADFFQKRAAILKQLGPLNVALEARLDFVFREVFKTCGATFDCWYVDGAEEGEVGDLESVINEKAGQIELGYLQMYDVEYDDEDNFNVLLDGEEWYLLDCLPLRWLFEDFKDELLQGQVDWQEARATKLAKAKERKAGNSQKKLALIETAKSKLTKEEVKALGIKSI